MYNVCVSCVEPSAVTLSKAVTLASSTGKPSLHTSGEKPQIMTLKLSDVPENLHTKLTQSTGNHSDEVNQLIDLIVGNGLLSYSKIAHLCLTPLQERTELFKRILMESYRTQGRICVQICL